MKKTYHVMKFLICDISGEQCGDVWAYSDPMLKPQCEICDLFQEYHQFNKKFKDKD